MHKLIKAALLGFACILASPIVGQANGPRHGAAAGGRTAQGDHRRPAALKLPVALHVSTGYQNLYRDSVWTPVRVTLHNRTSSDINGTLELPQSGAPPNLGPSRTFHGLYQTPVTLPAGGTKQVVVYVPGAGIRDEINARFVQGKRILGSAVSYTMGIDSSALLIGVLTDSPADSGWLVPASQQQITAHVVRLTPATLDSLPQALAAFDVIVLTDVNTAQLDRAQLSALAAFVRRGGSLLLVGGPNWQETLRPLPATLLPTGTYVGTRALPNLNGLQALGSVSRVVGPQEAVLSVLRLSGTSAGSRGPAATERIMAEQSGVPLVVRQTVGSGAVEYLAFDPALNPVQGWTGTTRLLAGLLASAAPTAVARTWAPLGFTSRFQKAFSTSATTSELSNIPASTLPLLAIFAALTLVYVLLLGPGNFLVLRLLRRQYLAWVTVPILALSYVGSAYGVTMHLKNGNVLLNTIGVVTLDGSSGAHPATFYVGLAAPLPGDYHLTYHAPALADPIPQLTDLSGDWWHTAPPTGTNPLGMRVQQGAQTDVTFLSMKTWAVRDVALNTTVNIPGRVTADLHLSAHGVITGSIHNGTSLNLLDPIIVAGDSIAQLSTIPSDSTIPASVHPEVDMTSQDQPSVWSHLYGTSSLASGDPFPFGPASCCDSSALAQEKSLTDRLENASAMLWETQNLSKLGEVTLVGWSEGPLGSFSVSGSAPRRRDLTLVAVPLSVGLPAAGPFELDKGTISARLIDISARPPSSSCCNWFSRNAQQLSVGPGGSMTFELDLPRAQGHVHLGQLAISVNSDSDSSDIGRVYDWRAGRWVHIDLTSGTAQLSEPDRFVAATGQILLRLQATDASGDVTVDDPSTDVQVSGSGSVS
jgi:hypothetical protein